MKYDQTSYDVATLVTESLLHRSLHSSFRNQLGIII